MEIKNPEDEVVKVGNVETIQTEKGTIKRVYMVNPKTGALENPVDMEKERE